MQSNPYLEDFYNRGREDGRLASKGGSVEFLTTMRYIERYLKPGDRVIEIGAGTGRYSHALAQKGYRVDAVELVQANIDVFKRNTQPGEQVAVTQGNALDLSGFADNTYDIVLLLGPLYHLYTKEDKLKALGEAIRVAKPGGKVFVAYCMSDASILEAGFKRKRLDIFVYIEKGLINPATFAASSKPEYVIEVVRKEDIDALMSELSTTRLHFIAADGYTNHMREEVDAMDDKVFALYLKYHFATCERADMIGLSHHTLDIFVK